LLPAFVGDVKQGRLLGGKGAPVWLDNSFKPAVLLLRPFRAPAVLVLKDIIERPGR
jgi:hypothetical protein